MPTKTIKVDNLARVEGEGALYVRVRDGKLTDIRFRIFEPPRFFEALLRGRRFSEAPDITARICGICPVAYQMSSVHALERAAGVQVGGQLRELRRLLYCGEWIESHALHIYLLHAPDFLGYDSGIALARDHADIVQRGLDLKKVGNSIMALLGGREIHPINVRVGGFYSVPSKADFDTLVEPLKRAREAAVETVRWVSTFDFPDFEPDYELVSLSHPDEYPMNEGRLISSAGLNIDAKEFEEHIVEEQVPHSHALHARLRERGGYLVGPLARYSLNFDRLSPLAQESAREAELATTCRNPYQSIVVRAVETVYACDEALRIIENFELPDAPFVEVEPRSASGWSCTEAPRGTLYHGYDVDEQGLVTSARIVPPTSQNQKMIEDDLRGVVTKNIDLSRDELSMECERSIRNYDPCISCATHFLTLDVDRE
ncbi:MAG: Ni/Fe hydrogenase subunit alpha [Nitrolancea sp.]